MRRIGDIVLVIALLGAVAYAYFFQHAFVQRVVAQVEKRVAPCRVPISYSLGSIDPRFRISTSTVVADLNDAETIWELTSGKNLFQYQPTGGDVTINFAYDGRQSAATKLANAGVQIDRSKESYDTLKAQYDSLAARVTSEEATYKSHAAAYKQREAAYNAEIQKWNSQGGAPKAEYDRLQSEKANLRGEFGSVQSLEEKVNSDAATLNALATALNKLIVQLNLNVAQYNQAGAAQGDFEEGLYESSAGVQKIDIYEFSNHIELVRLLAHEMGHALGLDHVADQQAIMYMINQGKSLQPSTDDVAELNRVCRSGVL